MSRVAEIARRLAYALDECAEGGETVTPLVVEGEIITDSDQPVQVLRATLNDGERIEITVEAW